MDTYQDCSTWVEIDLSAVENNISYLCQHTKVKVMAVIKANAYGHGALAAGQAARRGGADWFAVARAEEAVELRNSGFDAPMLLLGYTPPGRLEELIAQQVSLTAWDLEGAFKVSLAAQAVQQAARLHLKVDTGMSRLGAQIGEVQPLVEAISEMPGIRLEGIFTHFARADELDRSASDLQERRFRQVIRDLDSAGLKPPLVHASNSAASIYRPSAWFDMVRVGISIYGLQPSGERQLPFEFRPALAWKSVLSQVKILPPGRGVSYGHIYTTQHSERIGTVPVGYADGFRRMVGNEVLVKGKRVPVVGKVCMDQIMLQLDTVPDAKAGDEVVLIGRQGNEQITAEEVAARWGTINYEVTCGIASRVPRIFSK